MRQNKNLELQLEPITDHKAQRNLVRLRLNLTFNDLALGVDCSFDPSKRSRDIDHVANDVVALGIGNSLRCRAHGFSSVSAATPATAKGASRKRTPPVAGSSSEAS
jgi:hypothetical protein